MEGQNKLGSCGRWLACDADTSVRQLH